MNKGLLVVMVMIVMLVASVTSAKDPNNGLTTWVLTADGADHAVTARVGWIEKFFEFGGAVRYWDWTPEWGPQPEAAGGYVAIHIDEVVRLTDQLPDSGWEEFLHTLLGRPYVGIEGLVPLKGEQRTPKINWLVGTLISTDPDFRRAVAVEVASGQGVADDAETVLSIGAFLRW